MATLNEAVERLEREANETIAVVREQAEEIRALKEQLADLDPEALAERLDAIATALDGIQPTSPEPVEG